MLKTNTRIRQSAVLSAVLVLGFAGIAVPPPASAADWSLIGMFYDTDELGEAPGFGLRVGFPINQNTTFDITGFYFEDFERNFEDSSDDTLAFELSTNVADFGVTWTQQGDQGLQLGGGLSWVMQDIGSLQIAGIDLPVDGDADDEFGVYLKLGYKWQTGFSVEGMYRMVDVSVKDITILGLPTIPDSLDTDLNGYAINLAYSFGQ